MDICRAVTTMLSARALLGIFSWPIFSMSSFSILTRVEKMGVRPETIIDVGANVGQFSVAASKIFSKCKIFAFEPVPDSFEKLTRNTRDLANINIFPFAIGDSNTELSIRINSHRHSSSLLALGQAHVAAFPWAREEGTAKVEVKMLDSLADSIKLISPVLMKVDVQGYEAHVVRGAIATLAKIDWIILEASFQPLYQGEMTFVDISNLLFQNGFEFVGPMDWLPHPQTGDILQMDALFKRRTG